MNGSKTTENQDLSTVTFRQTQQSYAQEHILSALTLRRMGWLWTTGNSIHLSLPGTVNYSVAYCHMHN